MVRDAVKAVCVPRAKNGKLMPYPHSYTTLTRTFRIPVGPLAEATAGSNGLVAGSRSAGLAAIGELDLEVAGVPDQTGYLLDITVLDRAMREHAVPLFREAILREASTGTPTDVGALLTVAAQRIFASIAQPDAQSGAVVSGLTYRACAFRSVTVAFAPTSPASARTPAPSEPSERTAPMPTTPHAPSSPNRVTLTETFEFAASHRLHLPELSDDENRRVFGKCNNPNGHGHNYRIEVAASVEPAVNAQRTIDGGGIDFAAIEEIVGREIMARFDHRHLNLDCPEFAGLNPSVENIARVCYGLLLPRIAERGGHLEWVRVWETEKTSCRYPG